MCRCQQSSRLDQSINFAATNRDISITTCMGNHWWALEYWAQDKSSAYLRTVAKAVLVLVCNQPNIYMSVDDRSPLNALQYIILGLKFLLYVFKWFVYIHSQHWCFFESNRYGHFFSKLFLLVCYYMIKWFYRFQAHGPILAFLLLSSKCLSNNLVHVNALSINWPPWLVSWIRK